MKHELFTCLASALLAPAALAADVSYRSDILPLIKAQCLECHGDESPSLADFLQDQQKYKKDKQGPRFGTYGELIQMVGWPETGALMRRLDDGTQNADKKPGNMYKYLGAANPERAANLKILKAWVGEDAWSLGPSEKPNDAPATTTELMNKLKLKY
jgi:hypothetical protein